MFSWSDWVLVVDIKESLEVFIIDVELLGMFKDDVKVMVYDGVLIIEGECKYEEEFIDRK